MVSNVKIVQKVAIIFENKILILRRSNTDIKRPNAWDFVGGNIDDEDIQKYDAEILLNALAREIKEEAGIEINKNNLQQIYLNDGWKNDNGGLFIWIGYKLILNDKVEVKISDEHTEYKWVSKDELKDVDFGDPNGLFEKVGNIALG